jgi:hypothetical protein
MESCIEACVKKQHLDIFERAKTHSDNLVYRVKDMVSAFLNEHCLRGDGLCFVLIGSVGRKEALQASDIDFVPIAADQASLDQYAPLDQKLRARITEVLATKVSKGEELTKPTMIGYLIAPESIGGDSDSSAQLTKRVLLLTESVQAGGALCLRDIRSKLLDAYADKERTRGRHVLSLCNDISRYYKTLCIEYKSKIDEKQLDWCTRNVKLRHSRKLWFFANIMAVSALAEQHPQGDDAFRIALLDAFEKPPIVRLAHSIEGQRLALGRLLESYAYFLDFMSREENRTALSKVDHEKRYEMKLSNPFPSMKFNSDLIHAEIMAIMEELGMSMRSRIMSWFML